MDARSSALLFYLRQNSREKLTSVSKKTRIPVSTLYDQLKELEKKVITKHVSLVDFFELGYRAQAQILLKVGKGDREKVRKHLFCHANINTVYKTNHDFHFMVEGVFLNLRELDWFVEKLENDFDIENHRVHYLVEEVKKEGFLSENSF